MILSFKFYSETEAHTVALPPNLLLAYHDFKARKRMRIIFGLLLILIFGTAMFLTTKELQFIMGLATTAGGALLAFGLTDRKTHLLKIYACIMTIDFNDYISYIISELEKKTDSSVLRVTFPPKRVLKRVNRTLVTAQRLKELAEGCEELTHIEDALDFIGSYCDDVYGFIIKEVPQISQK